MIKINVTYNVISYESAKLGDFEETGFEIQDEEFESKEEALEWFGNTYGSFEDVSGSQETYQTCDPERCLHTGDETYYSIHF